MPEQIEKIRLKRGAESRRTSFIPEMGEPIFTTDNFKFYIGDGKTPGGILINTDTFVKLRITEDLTFDPVTKQHINLHGGSASYGIGVQSGTVYFRSGYNFAWYKNGIHSDTTFDPGLNGNTLMTLDQYGNLNLTGNICLNSDSQKTFITSTNATSALYGSIQINGIKQDWAGFYFADFNRYLLLNDSVFAIVEDKKTIWSITDNGTLHSQSGDIAEKYTVDYNNNINYSVGTVMNISNNVDYEAEICNCELSPSVIGIISETPAHVMSENVNGEIIGILGKLPVKIIGPIEKNKPIVSAGNGCARAIKSNDELIYKIGVSLETNNDHNEKLVMCFIK